MYCVTVSLTFHPLSPLPPTLNTPLLIFLPPNRWSSTLSVMYYLGHFPNATRHSMSVYWYSFFGLFGPPFSLLDSSRFSQITSIVVMGREIQCSPCGKLHAAFPTCCFLPTVTPPPPLPRQLWNERSSPSVLLLVVFSSTCRPLGAPVLLLTSWCSSPIAHLLVL